MNELVIRLKSGKELTIFCEDCSIVSYAKIPVSCMTHPFPGVRSGSFSAPGGVTPGNLTPPRDREAGETREHFRFDSV